VTIGITPAFASTAYGYIQQGAPIEGSFKYPTCCVKKLKEKLDESAAQEILRLGGYSWNSGMFVWATEQILNEFRLQMPGLSSTLEKIVADNISIQVSKKNLPLWLELANEALDYGVMENAEKMGELPAGGLGWRDVGSWDSLFEVLLIDMKGNIGVNDQNQALDSQNTLIYRSSGSERLKVTIGVNDMVVVDTRDVLLVCNSDQSQKVRAGVSHLRKHHQERYI